MIEDTNMLNCIPHIEVQKCYCFVIGAIISVSASVAQVLSHIKALKGACHCFLLIDL